MKLIGLTGGIGMGKSTVAELLQQHGARVIDSDRIAHQLVEAGQPALAEIATTFGPVVLNSSGQLERRELARIVFSDEARRRELEQILHPRIRAVWQAEVQRWRDSGEKIAVVVIPLLFETAAQTYFDSTACVACSVATQRSRLQQRGWDAMEIKRREEAQWAVEKKISASDFVIWTDSTLEATAAQLELICH